MNRLELEIAWRYLRSRRGSKLLSFNTVIAVGGVIVGVSALILIIGVMNGLQYDLREKILVGSPDLRVLTWGADMRMEDWEAPLATVRQQEGVVAAAPFVLTHGVLGLTSGTVRKFGSLYGLEPQTPDQPKATTISDHIESGSFDFISPDSGLIAVVLGRILASELGAQMGDSVVLATMASIKENSVGPPSYDVTYGVVTGIFKSGMYEYDKAYVFLDLRDAQELGGFGSAITGIDVQTPDRWSAPDLKDHLRTVLDPASFYLETWQEQNSALFSALKLEKMAMGVILLLIVLVAAFNIVSVLTMLVTDKTREIGILRAMGLTASAIRRVFLLQGLFIGMVGTGIGLVIGLASSLAVGRLELIPLNEEIYFIDHLPSRTEPFDVVVIVVASVLIALAATLSPSNQAARLYPIEAIRHE